MTDKRPVVPDGLTSESLSLARVDEVQATSGGNPRSRLIVGAIWSSVGSALVPEIPVVANVIIAFGAMVIARTGSRREQVLNALLALVAGCASTALLIGAYNIPMTLVSIACAFVLAEGFARGWLRTGGLLIAALAATGAMIGIDVVSTSLQGTSVTELITQVVNGTVEQSMGSLDLEGRVAILETRDMLLAYWPVVYFVVGLAMAACSLLGARMGATATGMPVEPGMIARYDVPLWVAGLFALGVAAELLGPRISFWSGELATVGANVVAAARIVLAQQGLSVLLWWLRGHGVRPMTRMLLLLVGVWLELSFALTSVVGLVDVAVNFRRLKRNRASLIPMPTGER